MEKGLIEVTGVPLEALVRAAYNPSRPQGLGFIHYQDSDLPDEDVAAIIDRSKNDKFMAVSMDYVKGRSCKFHVIRRDGKLFIRNSWYDHSTSQLESMLTAVGLSPDLVEKARREEKDFHDACVAKAMTALAEGSGTLQTSIDGGQDEDVNLGLYLAKDRGLVAEKYADGQSTWSALEKAA